MRRKRQAKWGAENRHCSRRGGSCKAPSSKPPESAPRTAAGSCLWLVSALRTEAARVARAAYRELVREGGLRPEGQEQQRRGASSCVCTCQGRLDYFLNPISFSLTSSQL